MLHFVIQTLAELMGDRSLEKFRVEYEKLHKALKKSHESEKRLMQKCRELNAEIVANSAKVATALKLSQDDQATIASLKKVQSLAGAVCSPVAAHYESIAMFHTGLNYSVHIIIGSETVRETQRERENSNSKTLILKDSSVTSIWTYLAASPCYTTKTNKHDNTTNKYYKHD